LRTIATALTDQQADIRIAFDQPGSGAGLPLGGVALRQQADKPTQRLVFFLEWEGVDDEHLFGADVELSGGERPRLSSGSRLIGSEDAVVVSHAHHAMPYLLSWMSTE
jgi:hypothetical protein